MSQRPHRCRTWAPRGQTPILEFNFNWKSLSAVAGLTFLSFYFRLYAGAVKSPQVIDFLQALVQHIRKPLLLVWDRLPAHRSRLVRDYIDQFDGRVQVEYLPAYAPELNPVEYIWGYWKQHELPNVCPNRLLATQRGCTVYPASHAPPTQTHHCLLETGFSLD